MGRYLFRILEVVGLLFIIPTAYVLFVDLEDRKSQRISQAWELIASVSPGNSGKIQALEYLNSEDCVYRLYRDMKRSSFRNRERYIPPSIWQKVRACRFSAFHWPSKKKQSLSGIDLSKETHGSAVYLTGVTLPYADISYANLSGSNLGTPRYTYTSSSYSPPRSDLSSANLLHTDFSNAYLVGVNFFDASINRTNFSGADLSRARMDSAYFSYVNFTGATMEEVDLRNSRIGGANLSGAFLIWANLSGAYLGSANLSGADLRAANLAGADLSGANLSGARIDSAYFGNVPDKLVTTEAQLVYPWQLFLKTGAYYNVESPPKIDNKLLKYFTPINRDKSCLWLKGMYLFDCQ
jgi:uncharacterized protein YjbI with pentapeptide repeats